jgi:hypothetical protein
MVPPVAYASVERNGGPAAAPPPLRNAVVDRVQGKHVGKGVCEYSSTLELAPGEQAIQEDSIAFDDSTCTMTVQRGTPIELPPVEDPAVSGMSTEEGSAQPAGERSLSALHGPARTAAVHSAGYYKSRFEDPVGIDVNSVRNNVNWYWNGSTVFNAFCAYSYGWYSPSGWQLKENNFFCRYENSQTQVRSSSYAHFRNGVFCLTIDTHTYYDRNNAYGRYNGYLVGQVNWRKSGGCTGLLSFHTQLVRTLN